MSAAPVRAQAPSQVDIELLINNGRLPEARTALAAHHPRTRSDSARALYHKGRILLGEGLTPDAVRSLEESVRINPKDGLVQYWLAVAYVRTALGKSRVQQAFHARRVRNALERATEYSPQLVDARLHLIQYYLRAPFVLGGSKARARAQADTIFQIDRLFGHMARAQVAEATGDAATAEREFNAAVTNFPNNQIGYNALGGYYRRVRKYALAVDLFQRMQQQFPPNAVTHLQLGRTIAEWGQQPERGERELQTALTMGLGNLDAASAHYHLGLVYQKLGDAARAKQSFDRARALDPTLERAMAARRSVQQ